MDPEIDAGVAAINAAAEGGRSQGLDWASSLTFDTGKEVSASLIDNIVIVLPRANLIIASCTVLQVDEYLREMKLSKHRMNHNFGVRVTYLRCSVSACPYRSRLLENLDYNEDIPHFEIEVLTATEHNHQVEVARERGLTALQKDIVRLSIERGQAAPKKVLYFTLLVRYDSRKDKTSVTNKTSLLYLRSSGNSTDYSR